MYGDVFNAQNPQLYSKTNILYWFGRHNKLDFTEIRKTLFFSPIINISSKVKGFWNLLIVKYEGGGHGGVGGEILTGLLLVNLHH